MRLFVAVELSDELKKPIIAYMHELKKAGVKGNYSPAQNLHLTLAFIGEVPDPAPVKAALQGVSVKPFRLSLGETGTFGDILWLGLKGNQGLSMLVKAVREALDAAGIRYDAKKFEPHVTVIRKAAGNWQQVKPPKGDMMVKRFALLKSEQKNGRMVYTEA